MIVYLILVLSYFNATPLSIKAISEFFEKIKTPNLTSVQLGFDTKLRRIK